MRFPPTAPFCGNGSRVEREVASLEIRVRFPVAAPVECNGNSIGKTERFIGFKSRGGHVSRVRLSPYSCRPRPCSGCCGDYMSRVRISSVAFAFARVVVAQR